MKLISLLLIVWIAAPSFAANEEQFQWLDVHFCKTTIEEVLGQYHNTKFFGDVNFLEVTESGETLGGEYDRVFLYLNPDGIIHGMYVEIVTGDIREIERELDLLASQRWQDNFYKESLEEEILWAAHVPGTDVGMTLIQDSTRFLRIFKQPSFDPKSIGIILRSVHACGWLSDNLRNQE